MIDWDRSWVKLEHQVLTIHLVSRADVNCPVEVCLAVGEKPLAVCFIELGLGAEWADYEALDDPTKELELREAIRILLKAGVREELHVANDGRRRVFYYLSGQGLDPTDRLVWDDGKGNWWPWTKYQSTTREYKPWI